MTHCDKLSLPLFIPVKELLYEHVIPSFFETVFDPIGLVTVKESFGNI